jgi:16S rRNA (guanine(966)-N(2))-methyltransferase RsmD
MMRIIGGENRGLKLATPRGREVRPILDRVRESLFSILRHDVPEARVADLFAGTGVIGLEALSRGAVSCVFVDKDPRCIATIKTNVEKTRVGDRARVIREDVFRSIELIAADGPLDLVFVDPPYRLMRSERNLDRVIEFVGRLGEADALADDGLLVFRFPSDVHLEPDIDRLTKTDQRRWGGMKIAMLKRRK